jgi:DNA-binding transcriptional regulator PaaX
MVTAGEDERAENSDNKYSLDNKGEQREAREKRQISSERRKWDTRTEHKQRE